MAPRLPDARPSKSKTGRESTAHGERERVGDNSLRYSKLSFPFPYFKIKMLQSYFLSYFVHGRVSRGGSQRSSSSQSWEPRTFLLSISHRS